MKFQNKNIYITGSNRGIGFGLALRAAQLKANLFLVNRSALKEEQLAELTQAGAKSITEVSLDLSGSKNIENFLSEIKLKQVDVFINNAGLLTGGLIEDQDFAGIQKMLQVNLNAVIQLSQGVIPQMIKQKSGYIVNNASVSGKMFFPCASTYAASKAAVVAFTECIHQELKETGVQTMLMITPGVKTDMYADIEVQYGKHLNMDDAPSFTPIEWATRVFKAMEAGESECWPTGSTRLGVWVGHHFPKAFQKAVKSRFKR